MKKLLLILSALVMLSCEAEIGVVGIPDIGDSGLLSEADSIPGNVKGLLDGIYYVREGKTEIGDTVIFKWNKDNLTIFTNKNEKYIVLKGGILGSVLIFEGFWRYARGSNTGFVQFNIKKDEGSLDLIGGTFPKKLIVRGLFIRDKNSFDADDKEHAAITLEYIRPINIKKPFWIIAHRGGGRNVDRLPHSENSVEIIKYAERVGANAIEIDVKRTKDNIPILYHDDKFSTRLINGEYLIGEVARYTLAQIRTFGTLKNGEKIPTLIEALDAAIYDTDLKLIWLDVKSKGLVELIVPIQTEYMAKAVAVGREMEIIIGMPSELVYDELMDMVDYLNIPSLCELSTDETEKSGSLIWAPRWSLGTQKAKVDKMHSLGKRCFVWTLDQPEFMDPFFDDVEFDGILSNHPSVVAYEYYIR
ncbi:MAG: glycerophosphodiester phosphodiesterase family protein [Candidatus Kapabacteria bacterium]|nr:glycerophosphodiester phosphodiesterase family protein [Candidatus Kapabacteria bacterium]